MKIVFCSPRPFSLAFGGLEVQLMQTKLALERLGVEVSLLDIYNLNQLDGVSLVHLFGSDYIYGQISRLLLTKKLPYVVSSVFFPINIDRLFHIIASKIPYNQENIRKFILKNSLCILPNSESEKKLIKRWYTPSNLIETIPNGVSKNIVGNNPDSFRKKFLPELPLNEKFILSVGRIEKRKNTLNLLLAARKLGVPILFIGQPSPVDKHYVTNFFNEVSKGHNFVKHIPFFVPGDKNLADAYAAAHVHALVSFLETPGLSSLEAGINGANLVVGKCGPVEEYFDKISWITTPNKISDITTNLEDALNHPRNYFQQSEFINTRYSWDTVGILTKKLYQKILGMKIDTEIL